MAAVSTSAADCPPVIELHHGDCVAGMAGLPASSVDVVVTSPPYNLDVQYSEYRDSMPRRDYIEWLFRWAEQVERVLKSDGALFLNVGSSPANPLLPHQIVLRLEPILRLQNTIHWIKSLTVQRPHEAEFSVGHFKPIQSKRYLTDCHEYVFHLTKTGALPINRLAVGVQYADKSNIARWGHTAGRDRRCRGNNWFVPYQTIQSRAAERPHPATFPVRLAEMCIDLHGAPGPLVVLDPFLGIGTCGIAALNSRVGKFIGFEIDQQYLEEAAARIRTSARGSQANTRRFGQSDTAKTDEASPLLF